MMREPSLADVARWFRAATADGIVGEEDTVFILYDLATQADRRARVRAAFPSHWRHSIALKTNPIPTLLLDAAADGFGFEAASAAELALTRRVPATPFVVWDSPVKTSSEVAGARTTVGDVPLLVNFDGLDELHLLDLLPPGVRCGLRVNPLVGRTGPADLSTATADSKFGEPMTNLDDLLTALDDERISALHVHSGSQALDHTPLVEGVRRVLDLRDRANERRRRAGRRLLETIDIGGGLAVDYSGTSPVSVEAYATDLLALCPELRDPALDVVTELGRYYHASAGVVLSRVARVRRETDRVMLWHHAGADLFVRETYQSGSWPHRVGVLRADGEVASGPTSPTDLAGPLCFAGDYLQRGTDLPEVAPGDWLVIRDAGANSFALWSRHCSRVSPAVLAVEGAQPDARPSIARARESIDDVVAFWG